jgi:uncharacterized protein YjbI with pentapeptide repeats
MLKHSALALAALFGLAAPALAQPITSEAERARTVQAVKEGRRACVRCDLFQAEFSYMDLSGRNFTGARLRQADLDIASLNDARLNGADLSVANAFGARFTGVNLAGANLTQGNFVGAHFEGANLSRARLEGAIFSGADLSEARGLTQAQLNAACGDSATVLPRGLSVPACSGIGATP